MCQTRSQKHYWQCRAGKTGRIAVSFRGRGASNAKIVNIMPSRPSPLQRRQSSMPTRERATQKTFFLLKLWNHYLRGDETEIWREQWDKSWIAADCSQRTRLKRVAACWWISIIFRCSLACRTTAVKERKFKHDDFDVAESQGSLKRHFNHSLMFIRNNSGCLQWGRRFLGIGKQCRKRTRFIGCSTQSDWK